MDQINSLIARHGMQKHAEIIRSLARPCIRLSSHRKRQSVIRPSDSRLGGIPHIPEGTSWPTWGNETLSHLATINCAEATVFDAQHFLPRDGLLQFWYVEEQNAWGFDPKDAGAYRVDYVPKGTTLRLAKPPEDLETFEACEVKFTASTSLPNYDWLRTYAEENKGLSDMPGYDAMEKELRAIRGPHQMLGHASPLQASMELECQLVTNGLYCGNSSGYNDARAKKLAKGSLDWRLLLQLNTEEDGPGWMWADGGRLYCWIHQNDLIGRRFDRCWGILQC